MDGVVTRGVWGMGCRGWDWRGLAAGLVQCLGLELGEVVPAPEGLAGDAQVTGDEGEAVTLEEEGEGAELNGAEGPGAARWV